MLFDGVYCDATCHGKNGSGIGVALVRNGKAVATHSRFVEIADNNEAECEAIRYARSLYSDRAVVFTDSRNAADTMNAIWVRRSDNRYAHLAASRKAPGKDTPVPSPSKTHRRASRKRFVGAGCWGY
jgi:ribonuclease HI